MRGTCEPLSGGQPLAKMTSEEEACGSGDIVMTQPPVKEKSVATKAGVPRARLSPQPRLVMNRRRRERQYRPVEAVGAVGNNQGARLTFRPE